MRYDRRICSTRAANLNPVSFERLLLAPIDLNLLMLAKTGGASLFGVLNAIVPLLVAAFLVDLSGIGWPVVMAGILLIAATSTFSETEQIACT